MATARVTGVSEADLRGPTRHKHIARARQLGMAAAIALGFTLTQAAETFHRTDHTTSLWANRKIRQMAQESPEVNNMLQAILGEFKP